MSTSKKRNIHALLFSVFILASGHSLAITAPQYLSIPAVDKCLGEKNMGSFSVRCMPAKKPLACSNSSWKALHALKGQQKVPACAPKEATQK